MRSDRTLKAWYREINSRYFDSELPDNVCVRWVNEDDLDEDERIEEKASGFSQKLSGDSHYAQVVLSNDLRKARCQRLAVLVHEMIHVATDFRDDHGEAFERWRVRLAQRGIFKKGAVLRGVTLF